MHSSKSFVKDKTSLESGVHAYLYAPRLKLRPAYFLHTRTHCIPGLLHIHELHMALWSINNRLRYRNLSRELQSGQDGERTPSLPIHRDALIPVMSQRSVMTNESREV